MIIIDCHCHAGKGDGLTGPWDTVASLNRFLERSAAAGIQKTVLFPAFNADYATANAAVARIVASNRERFYGFAFVNAQSDKGRIFEMVRTAIEQYGFVGIKAHRHDARLTREVCEAAKSFEIPILYDVMGEITPIELLATEYPTVNFIIPHLGSFADDWRAQLSFIPMLERHANIYTDTSGVKRFDLLEMAAERAGAHKILFGTDGPWLHPNVELEKIFALQLPTAETQLILANNFLRLTKQIRNGTHHEMELKQTSEMENRVVGGRNGTIAPSKKLNDFFKGTAYKAVRDVSGILKKTANPENPNRFYDTVERQFIKHFTNDSKTRKITTLKSSSNYRSPDFYRSLKSGGLQRVEVTSIYSSITNITTDEVLMARITNAIQRKVKREQLLFPLETPEGRLLPAGGIICIGIRKANIHITRLKRVATQVLNTLRASMPAYLDNILIAACNELNNEFEVIASLR
jgi:uncharacterized protein